jgi:NADH-quinone oxidoreductase subunit A
MLLAQAESLGGKFAAEPIWPLLVYLALAVLTVVAMMVISYVLGQRHSDLATARPIESGMEPTGSARIRFHADFYLVGLFFVIFDIETMFIVTWAIAIRQAGWAGYVEILIFIAMLLLGLVYLWRSKALDWGENSRRPIGRSSMEGRRA